jgi:hypothetical protein
MNAWTVALGYCRADRLKSVIDFELPEQGGLTYNFPYETRE